MSIAMLIKREKNVTRATQSNEIHLSSVWYFNHIGIKKEDKTFKMNAKKQQ